MYIFDRKLMAELRSNEKFNLNQRLEFKAVIFFEQKEANYICVHNNY